MTGRLQSRLERDHFRHCFLYIFIVFEFMIIYIALDCTGASFYAALCSLLFNCHCIPLMIILSDDSTFAYICTLSFFFT